MSSSGARYKVRVSVRASSRQILALRIAQVDVVLLLDLWRVGRGTRFRREPQRPFEVVTRIPIVRGRTQQSPVARLGFLDHGDRLERAGRTVAHALTQVHVAKIEQRRAPD